ncbi:hypothetical protein PR048_012415 [Dryococelus australis]|uniref:DDE-1 domain-containing protein n=1 Tax=Dryococelus australis TaxID=614101 RepID=A0ABQ9HQ53_9NEOP|nr:hypothetical protein PR048_012415 [Dryococelus australis]
MHNLSLKKPKIESVPSRQGADPFVLNYFFDKLEEILIENALENKPHCIYNCDETSLNSNPSSTKVVAERGKNVHRVTEGSGQDKTVLACVQADGSKLPQLVLHKGKRLSDSMFGNEKEYPGTSYFVSDKRRMTEDVFYSWFTNFFIPQVIWHKAKIVKTYVNLVLQLQILLLRQIPLLTKKLQASLLNSFHRKAKWSNEKS